MPEESDKQLTAQQLKAIALLRAGVTQEEVAQAVKAHRTTILRWLRQPAFKKIIAEGTKVAEADLQAAHKGVVEEITRLGKESPLNAKKLKETLDVEKKLAQLLTPTEEVMKKASGPEIVVQFNRLTREEVEANPTLREFLAEEDAGTARDEDMGPGAYAE